MTNFRFAVIVLISWLVYWDFKVMVITLFPWLNSYRPSGAGLRQWCTFSSVNYAIFGSDNGLSPLWCQAIDLIRAGLLLIGPLGTNFSEILIKIQQFFHKIDSIVCSMATNLSWSQSVKCATDSLPDKHCFDISTRPESFELNIWIFQALLVLQLRLPDH